MCGRYVLRKKTSREDMLDKGEEYDHDWHEYWDILHLDKNLEHSRFNIGPHPHITAPVITDKGYQEMLFGMKPDWAKSTLINAKSENLKQSRFWKPLAAMRPCLIPAHGFYEPKGEKGQKRPWYGFEFEQQQGFFMAGMWKPIEDKNHFVILTREPDASVSPIHSRMPVIFTHNLINEAQIWLNTRESLDKRIETVKEEFEFRELRSFRVSDAAKNMGNEGEELFKPQEESNELF